MQKNNTQDPVPWHKTEKPWTRLHIDFVGPIEGMMYLIVIDSHSKWPEVIPLTTSIIVALDKGYGISEMLVSDNVSHRHSSLKSASIGRLIMYLHTTHRLMG